MLPSLGRLVVDLLELLEDVLDDRRRPYARLGLQERRRPQNVLKHLRYHGTARDLAAVGDLSAGAVRLTRTWNIFRLAVSTGKPMSSRSSMLLLPRTICNRHTRRLHFW
jgi:hypothetical protein